ncbi:MAG: response regulator [Planctomycetota bacterium]
MSLDRRILIADDDREVRSGVVDLLRDLDMDFVQAETGVQALQILRNSVIDLALLDMHMPGHTGLEVLSVIRRETPEIPCIFFSGDATEAIRRQALLEGALAVLSKPLVPAMLRSEVRRALHIASRESF